MKLSAVKPYPITVKVYSPYLAYGLYLFAKLETRESNREAETTTILPHFSSILFA